MLKENFAENQPPYDLRKRSARTQYPFANLLLSGSRTTVDLIGGVAEAVAQASHEFSNELADAGPSGAALTNSLIRGFVKGNVRFLEEIAKTTERIYEDLTYRREDTSKQSSEPIDYERLARLVADQMRAQQEGK